MEFRVQFSISNHPSLGIPKSIFMKLLGIHVLWKKTKKKNQGVGVPWENMYILRTLQIGKTSFLTNKTSCRMMNRPITSMSISFEKFNRPKNPWDLIGCQVATCFWGPFQGVIRVRVWCFKGSGVKIVRQALDLRASVFHDSPTCKKKNKRQQSSKKTFKYQTKTYQSKTYQIQTMLKQK